MIEITHFVLWKGKNHKFTGQAKFFGLREYPCIINKHNVVLIRRNEKWEMIGRFYEYEEPIKIRSDKVYECIGEIWTGSNQYHVMKKNKIYEAI